LTYYRRLTEMKKIVLATLGLVALGFTSLSWGMPVYTGNTAADFATNPGSASSNAAGYYIWSDAGQENWSVRWTGNNFGDTTWYNWFGCVLMTNLVDGSVNAVQFESSQPDLIFSGTDFLGSTLDVVAFNGYAGPAYDGFDFTVDRSVASSLVFMLGSNMFSGMAPGNDDQAGMGIYLGQGYASPMVQVQQGFAGGVQRFETTATAAVPEPSTILLMAGGLIGMGASRIRRRKV
jgi:hypothetical protein